MEGAIPDRARSLKDVPARAFHGAKDDVVPLAESRTVGDTVKNYGVSAELVVSPDANHDAWTATYGDPPLREWLLSHRRRARP